jgi:hypothetical protein
MHSGTLPLDSAVALMVAKLPNSFPLALQAPARHAVTFVQ